MYGSLIKSLCFICLFLLLGILSGCAGREFAPKHGIWYYPKELPAADRAVDAAQQAGKDKKCPDEFTAARVRKENAYTIYLQCRTEEGIQLAKAAKKMADSLCPKLPAAAPPPPGPQPKPLEIAIPEEKIINRMILNINFDFDKAVIRPRDYPKMDQAIEFVRKYPKATIVIDGHTDSIGTVEYNHKLSHRRADATKEYLINQAGIPESRIKTRGFGKSRPITPNKEAWGRFTNRRVEILIVSE